MYYPCTTVQFTTTCTLLNCTNIIPNTCIISLKLSNETIQELQALFSSSYIKDSTILIDNINVPSFIDCAFSSVEDIRTPDGSTLTLLSIKSVFNSSITAKINMEFICEIRYSNGTLVRFPMFKIQSICVNAA